MVDSDPIATYRYGAEQLAALGIWYLHVVEPAGSEPRVLPHLRRAFSGPIVLNGGRDLPSGNAALAEGEADAISFASKFLANPDLPARLREGAALTPPRYETFYTPGPEGYLDYARLPDA
jgi:N-ethylmaleimide reductase